MIKYIYTCSKVVIFALMVFSGAKPAYAQVHVELEHALVLPDLVIAEFELKDQGIKSGDFMKYNFKLKITNASKKDIKGPFYFTIMQKTPNMTEFGMTDNHFKVLHLNAGQNLLMEHTFKLNVTNVSGKTIQIKGWIDSGGDREMPPAYRDVLESNEDNNFSEIITISGAYTPNIASITPMYPASQVKIGGSTQDSGDTIRISGLGFGKQQGNHTIALYPLANIADVKTVNIISWSDGVVYFTIPEEADPGRYTMAIVDKGTMQRRSNSFNVFVCARRDMPWTSVIEQWTAFKEAFYLRIHTWGGKAIYDNQSTLKLISKIPDTIDVDEIKLNKKNLGRYRYYLNDFKSKPGEITLHRFSLDGVKLLDNELRLQILFESAGLEIKGYFQALGSSSWKDHGAPDLDVDNAKLSIIMAFSFKNGRLDYTTPSVYFNADIDARDPAADWFFDFFISEWDRQLVSMVKKEIAKSFNSSETKTDLTRSFLELIIGKSHAPKAKIVDVRFTGTDILLTYYLQ